MVVNHAITQQILQTPDGVAMRKVALAEGMTSLLQHGASFVVEGVTTVGEVLRVARGIEGG